MGVGVSVDVGMGMGVAVFVDMVVWFGSGVFQFSVWFSGTVGLVSVVLILRFNMGGWVV